MSLRDPPPYILFPFSDQLSVLKFLFPELRELSSRAAFKGYNVLKKIEGMEGFSAKDKSVPDIDKTIAKDVTVIVHKG